MSEIQQHQPVNTTRALRWTIFLGATALVVYLCARILSPFLNVLAWSLVLAVIFHPLHLFLVRKTGRVALSAFISSALVVVAVVIPLLSMAGLAVNQLLAFGNLVQHRFADEGALSAAGPFGQAFQWLTIRLGFDTATVAPILRQNANELGQMVAHYTMTVAASTTSAVLSFVLIIFATFLLFCDGDRIVARIPTLLPFERARSQALLDRIATVIYASVYGVGVIALIQGALCGGMFWVMGVPSAALWGLVTMLTSVLPIIGAAAVWGPAALYLVAIGHWPQAIGLAVWGALIVSSVDNFLRPRLVGGRIGMSELVTFFALLGGLQAFGILGIVLGPVLFAVAASIVDVLSDSTAVVANDESIESAVAPPSAGSA